MKGFSFRDSDNAYTAGERFMWSDVGLGDKGMGPFRSTWPFKHANDICLSWTLGVASSLYTPSNIETPDLQPSDRPYGAWLYGLYRLSRVKLIRNPHDPHWFDAKTADSVEFDAGIVGPGAAGRYFQNTVHTIFGVRSRVGPGIKLARGWHHQLRNEGAFNLEFLHRTRVLGQPAASESRHADLIVERGAAAGTIFTWLNGGAVLRGGSYVPNDFGPFGRPPTILNADRQQPFTPFEPSASRGEASPAFFYGFARIEGRAVIRNGFLDGNLFADDRVDRGRVQKNATVGDLEFGAVLQLSRSFRFTYRNVWRSPEFKSTTDNAPLADAHSHRFGSLTLEVGRVF